MYHFDQADKKTSKIIKSIQAPMPVYPLLRCCHPEEIRGKVQSATRRRAKCIERTRYIAARGRTEIRNAVARNAITQARTCPSDIGHFS